MAIRGLVILTRVAAVISLLVIVLASVAPAPLRPTIGAAGFIEHMIAYAVCGFLFVSGFATWPVTLVGLGLAAIADVLELAQLYIPGRQARISDAVFSATGAVAGILAAWLLRRKYAASASPGE